MEREEQLKNLSVDSSVDVSEAFSSDQLLPLVYEELRQLAQKRIKAEFSKQSLQATDLVHEAYLRLKKGDSQVSWNSLNHFFGAASIAMRRILVERARHRKTSKRGGGAAHKPLSQIEVIEKNMECDKIDVIALDEAIEVLADKHQRVARLVELRFFLGMTIKETADVLQISTSTAELDWRYARSFLKVELSSFE